MQQQVLGAGRDGHLPVDGGGPEVQVALGHPVLDLRQVVRLRVEVVRLGQQRDQQLHQDQPADRAGEEPLARSGRTPGVDRRGEKAGGPPTGPGRRAGGLAALGDRGGHVGAATGRHRADRHRPRRAPTALTARPRTGCPRVGRPSPAQTGRRRGSDQEEQPGDCERGPGQRVRRAEHLDDEHRVRPAEQDGAHHGEPQRCHRTCLAWPRRDGEQEHRGGRNRREQGAGSRHGGSKHH